MKQKALVFAILFLTSCGGIKLLAQAPPYIIKKTADKNKADLIKLNEMLDKVKTEPTNKNTSSNQSKKENSKVINSGSSSSPKISSKYSRSKSNYTINKKGIESNYKYLTPEEKEKVKNLPPAPDAIRNSDQAKELVNQLSNFNGIKEINAASKSMQLTGYYMHYYKIKQKAENVVQESDKLEFEFKKNNPTINFGSKVGKTYTSENSLVYLPLGDASFADEVVASNYIKGDIKFPVENCLGVPDYIEEANVKNNKGIYSLGLNGTLTVKFTNNALVDVNGPDLFVFEAGAIEPTNLEISKDGNTWVNVGTISGGTASVDIHNYVKPNEYYYYVRLTDLTTQSSIPGADIDAIAAIGAAIKLNLNAEVLFDFGKAILKEEGINAIKKLAAELKTMPNAQLNIDGYTDDIGTNDENNKLSLQRAQAVSAILKQELKNNIGFVYNETGKGKANPIVPNTNEENRKKNRRVEILVTPK
ncbi:MAG: OmpA family protein [Ferruginibacter sp.]|nr:OmpA family protein [Ferruginibacter sp.]